MEKETKKILEYCDLMLNYFTITLSEWDNSVLNKYGDETRTKIEEDLLIVKEFKEKLENNCLDDLELTLKFEKRLNGFLKALSKINKVIK